MEIQYFTPMGVPLKIGSDGGGGFVSHGGAGRAINHGDARLPKTQPSFAHSHQDPEMTREDTLWTVINVMVLIIVLFMFTESGF